MPNADENQNMFRVKDQNPLRRARWAIIGLLLLTAGALFVTLWFVVDFSREQEIVQKLIRDLPRRDLDDANELAGELKWQSRLIFLIILQVVSAGLAVALLWRAYRSTQDSLRDFKALAGDILSSMDQGIVTVSNLGTVTSLNARAMEILEIEHDSIGQPLETLTNKMDLVGFRELANRTPDRSQMDDFLVSVRGRPTWLRTFCQPLSDVAGSTIGNVIQMRDVTSERHVEDQMRRMERYMGLGSLAAGLHHEIRNPLAAISLHVQLLEEQLEADPASPDVPQMLCVIKTEMNRVGAVLEGFRDFASTSKLDRSETCLREMIDQQVELITPKANRQNIRLTVDYDPDLPETVELDRTRIEQVVLNLMLNAIEAMGDGGHLMLRVEQRKEDAGAMVVIAISDTGPGIPDDIRDHIFDAYFTTKNHGTGMGLALSDKIARQHGGRLELTTGDAGTTFELALPEVTDAVASQPQSH